MTEPAGLSKGERHKRFGRKSLILLVLLVVAAWFYWFQLRPALAVRACNARVSAKYDQPLKEVIARKLGGGYEIEYRQCLRAHGLAK